MIAALTLALLLSVPAAADEPDPEPASSAQADLKKMQGTWEIVRAERNGRPSEKETKGVVVIIHKDRLVIRDPNSKNDEAVTIKLDAKKKPRQIDLTIEKRRRETVLGIYKFEKGELTLVFGEPGQPRPKGFAAVSRGKLVLKKQMAK